MPIRFRKILRFGPLRANLSNSGISWPAKLGPLSWNSRRRRGRVNLPGPFSYDTKDRI